MTLTLMLALACAPGGADSLKDKEEVTPLIVPGEPIACEDPAARGEQAFDHADPGPDWDEVWYTDLGNSDLPRVEGGGVTLVDLDGDERLDIVLPGDGLQIYMAQPDGTWEDQSEDRLPPGYVNASTAVFAADMDADGAKDLFYCSLPGFNELLFNDGYGNFEARFDERITFHSALRSCKGFGFGDIDGDRDLDFAIASQQPCDDPEMSCLDPENGYAEFLYLNNGDGTFTDVSDRMPMADLVVSDMHNVAFVDLDADGDLDLFIVNDHKLAATVLEGNLAYMNDGTGHFTRMGPGSGLEQEMAGMGLSLTDFNGDFRPELLVSGSTMMAMLISGPENTWYDAALSLGIAVSEPRKSAWGNEFVDLDHDMDVDAVAMFGWTPTDTVGNNLEEQPDAVWIQGDGWRFDEQAMDWDLADDGVGRGIAVGDINADGWMDLVTRNLYGPAHMYLSRCGEPSWIRIRLRGQPPNTDAIGARVDVEAKGRVQSRWIMGGGISLYGTSPAEAHFGLADAEAVERVRVTWPDGEVTELENVAARTVFVIDEE